jgi:hypothetical protein
MIKLTAITSEEEPHSTVAAFIVLPSRECHVVHAGDSRIYHFRGPDMMFRTSDHSYVQRLIDEGDLTEEEANTHPQSNLLTGCLGTVRDPPVSLTSLGRLEVGDSVMACSDGLWHYFSPIELGSISHALPPREAGEMLIGKARERAGRPAGLSPDERPGRVFRLAKVGPRYRDRAEPASSGFSARRLAQAGSPAAAARAPPTTCRKAAVVCVPATPGPRPRGVSASRQPGSRHLFRHCRAAGCCAVAGPPRQQSRQPARRPRPCAVRPSHRQPVG